MHGHKSRQSQGGAEMQMKGQPHSPEAHSGVSRELGHKAPSTPMAAPRFPAKPGKQTCPAPFPESGSEKQGGGRFWVPRAGRIPCLRSAHRHSVVRGICCSWVGSPLKQTQRPSPHPVTTSSPILFYPSPTLIPQPGCG